MKIEKREIEVGGVIITIEVVVPEDAPNDQKQDDWDKQEMLDDYD